MKNQIPNNDIQPELFDISVYSSMPKCDCSNCDYGYWHTYDIDRFKIGRAPTCTYCAGCKYFEPVLVELSDKYKFLRKLLYTSKQLKDGTLQILKRTFKDKWTEKRKEIIIDSEELLTEKAVNTTEIQVEHDLFDVSQDDTANRELQEKEHELKNEEAHKTLELKWFENPHNDNEQLFNYQYLWIKNKDINAWYKLLELSTNVMQRLLWQYLSENKGVFWDEITQSEKVSEAVFYVLRRYETQIGWHVSTNFIGALKSGLLHVTRYETKLDQNTVVTDDVNKFRRNNNG